MKQKTKVVAILLAYNAERTLKQFFKSLPLNILDDVILVDDNSKDETFSLSKRLGIRTFRNKKNLGYGGNLKRALSIALKEGADVIIDIHPDGEYKTDAIIPALKIIRQRAKFVIGNRFYNENYIKEVSGIYMWKYYAIKSLNLLEKKILGLKVHDLHQGFRVYTKELLKKVPFEKNSNSYLFSFELISQCVFFKIPIYEVPVKTSYSGEKRGATLINSIIYTLGTFRVLVLFFIAKAGLMHSALYTSKE